MNGEQKDKCAITSNQSLIADVLAFLKTQQRAEEICRAMLEKWPGGAQYAGSEAEKAFNERVRLIARIESLPVETTGYACPSCAGAGCSNCYPASANDEIAALRSALRGLMPEGWDDPDGHMDHMPGIRTARLLLAGSSVEPSLPIVSNRAQGTDCPYCEDDVPHTHTAKAGAHTTEDDFQHWLSYTGGKGTLQQAFYAGRDVPPPEKAPDEDTRQIVREELQRARKAGCGNFQMRDGLGFCRNCGFHHDEH